MAITVTLHSTGETFDELTTIRISQISLDSGNSKFDKKIENKYLKKWTELASGFDTRQVRCDILQFLGKFENLEFDSWVVITTPSQADPSGKILLTSSENS
jgi:hypothetical protein